MAVIVPTKREDTCARSKGPPSKHAATATKTIKAVNAAKPFKAVEAVDKKPRINGAGRRIFVLLFISRFPMEVDESEIRGGKVILISVDEPAQQKVEKAVP
jgi:hypothetical protein